ncbi:PAS domain-containing protein [Nitrospira sp. BLG_2]|uniref:PAS domain-containing protein n=1 Tax=Nitrospira sp. BLG_2 TaxID=3397507 RepID=UPI003B9994A3
MNRSRDSWIVRYGFAVLVVALATLIRFAVKPIIPSGYPFFTFFLAVMLAAWRGGLGPGLVASVLSTLVADLLFIEPIYAVALTGGSWVSLSIFVVEVVAITMITERIKGIQRDLHESESRFRLIADAAPVLIWIAGTDKHCTYFNRGWLNFTGRTLEQEIGDGWTKGVHPDDYERCLKTYVDAFERRQPFTMEYRLRRADSEYGWIVDQGVPLWGDHREFRGYIGACADISSHKQMEDALRHSEARLRSSEARLRSILSHAPTAIFIKDPAGRYLFMNEECARVLGVNPQKSLGYTDRDLLPSELAAQFMANDQQVWNSEKLLTIEEMVPQADGIHTSLVRKFLLQDEGGRAYALSGIAMDITSHLKLEAAIHASEARLQLAQSAANIGVFDWDITAQKSIWSPELERMWGLPVGGFDGTVETWRRLVHPDDLALAYAGIQRSLKDPMTAFEYEYRIVRPDGAMRWIHAKAKTLCDAEGRAIRMVGVNLDITDRKEAQLRLERSAQELEAQIEDRTRDLVQSQERLRALTSELNMAEQRERKRLATELHDHLQQMLVVGKLIIGQGKRKASGVPAYESVLKKVDDILSDALTYSRTLVAELSPTVLRDHGLAASFKWLAEYMKKSHEHTVTALVPDDQGLNLPEDHRVLLFQSVRELLINSAKYAGTGQATLTMKKRADHLFITVKDEGKGFDVAAGGASGGAISSKFGLYSIQERMRALGGSFEIQSAPGKGTNAILVLPLTGSVAGQGAVSCDLPFISHRSQAETFPGDPSTICVLLVDDHAMIRQGLRTMLEAYTDIHITGEAANGEEAITLAQTLQPHVVLMDINMPKMNGIEATAVIKRSFPGMVIVGLSVNADRGNHKAMIQAGAATLLTKEAPVEELYQTIQSAVKSLSNRKSF